MVEEGSTTLMAGEKVMIGELEITKFTSGVPSTNLYLEKYVLSFTFHHKIKVLPSIVSL